MIGHALQAVTFNGWVGQGHEAGTAHVEELLVDLNRPPVASLQEVPWLGHVTGYNAIRAAEAGEARNNALLLRKDLTVHRVGLLEMRHRPWVGPKHGHTHAPRVMPWAEVSLPGEWRRWCLLDVHRITSTHGRNDEQRAAELTQLDGWLTAHRRRHPRRPTVALGDWNGHPGTLARAHRAELTLDGVDGSLAVNATVVRGRTLASRYGSDGHNPVLLTLARKAHR